MGKRTSSRALSRRRFIGACCAAGAVGLAGLGYGIESAPLAAPLAPAGDVRDPRRPVLPAPDVPALLVINPHSTNPFSHYLAEILRAEGLLAFRLAFLDQVDAGYLAKFGVVLLGDGPLDADAAALFEGYVAAGGSLITMRPDPRLDRVLGVASLGGHTVGGHLRVAEAGALLSPGIDDGPLQFHGRALQLELREAQALAWLESAGQRLPGVVLNRFGQGRAAAWAFDLAESVALTRQGDPAHANQERDDIDGTRTTDLFVGWVDLDRIGVPQADEQQRLLVALLRGLCDAPLPSLWYLPAGARSALILTGDAHGSPLRHIEEVYARVERYGGHMSVYYTPQMGGPLRRIYRKARWWAADLPVVGDFFEPASPLPGPADVAAWRARGHEFGMHPYVEGGLEEGYHEYWTQFVKLGYGALTPTVRTHRVLWHGWVENARVQASYGVRMNLDYYHIGGAVRKPDGEWVFGHMTGSGMPMRLIDESGALLDVYQQHTHLVDEHLMNVFDTGHDMGLGAAEAIAISTRLIGESARRYPAALGVQCHIDPFLLGGAKAEQAGRWLDGTLEFAAANGIPILSAEQWLMFTEARRGVVIDAMHWDAGERRLMLTLTLPNSSDSDFALLLPLEHQGGRLRGVLLNAQEAHVEERASDSLGVIQITTGRHTLQAMY